jgi:hypothetical protein
LAKQGLVASIEPVSQLFGLKDPLTGSFRVTSQMHGMLLAVVGGCEPVEDFAHFLFIHLRLNIAYFCPSINDSLMDCASYILENEDFPNENGVS